jgi:hypothetical protein
LIAPHRVNIARLAFRLAAALAPALAAATGAAAQTAAPAPCGGDAARTDTAGAAVVIRASVTIDELRFDSDPRASVRVTGCPGGDGVRVVERRNLPEHVQPGVTYRDVYVAVEILGRVEAACIAGLAGDSDLARTCAPAAGTTAGDTARAPPAP